MFENSSGILWYVHIPETSKSHNLNELASCALKASSDDCKTTEDPNCEVQGGSRGKGDGKQRGGQEEVHTQYIVSSTSLRVWRMRRELYTYSQAA